MPTYQLFRTTPTFNLNISTKIDRQNAVLRDVCAMQAGEAMGHGCMADQRTLYMMVELGNQKGKIRQRLGHPGISENATGKQVGIAKSFRVAGDKLIHDSHLLDVARKSPVFTQDVIDYLLTVAEKAPTELGESVVISAGLVWPLEDGREVETDEWGDLVNKPEDVRTDSGGRPLTAITPLPALRPVEFHAVDYVSEGALTPDGMFAADPDVLAQAFAGHSSEFADQIFQTVDAWRERYNIPLSALPEKVEQVVSTYMALRQKDRTMRKKYTMEQEPELIPVDTPVEETEVEESDPVDDALADAEVLAASLVNDDGQQLAIATQIQQLQAQFATLSAQVERISSLLVKNLEATATIHRNMRRMNGEPVVSEKVPAARQNPLETLAYAHPTPANGFTMAANLSTQLTERNGSDYGVTPNDTPGVAAMKQQAARNARLGR